MNASPPAAHHDHSEGDPSSFVLPNPVPFLFPVYWLTVLALRRVRELVSPIPRRAQRLLTGLNYAEGPRIRGRSTLYFSEMHHATVYALDLASGAPVRTFDLRRHATRTSGLGWLPNGDMLVVAMDELSILRVRDGGGDGVVEISVYADVSKLARERLNDMCVDERGAAYVGNFGFNVSNLTTLRATTLARVSPGGMPTATAMARDMVFPNGCVITPDGSTLIVAETMAGRLTSFDIDPVSGVLSNRALWAYVGLPLDGICLDAAGRVWAAAPGIGAARFTGGAVRVHRGGAIDDTIGFGANAIPHGVVACTLWTDDKCKHWLVATTAYTTVEPVMERIGTQNASIVKIEVDCGPAKRPGDDRYHAGYC